MTVEQWHVYGMGILLLVIMILVLIIPSDLLAHFYV